MKAITQCAATAALAAALACPSLSLAQDNAWNGGGGAGGNWLDTTWTQGGTPNSSFDARAVIGSTAGSASPTGVVNVTSDIRVSHPSPTIVLGNGAATHGTLNITAIGKMHAQNVPPSAG